MFEPIDRLKCQFMSWNLEFLIYSKNISSVEKTPKYKKKKEETIRHWLNGIEIEHRHVS